MIEKSCSKIVSWTYCKTRPALPAGVHGADRGQCDHPSNDTADNNVGAPYKQSITPGRRDLYETITVSLYAKLAEGLGGELWTKSSMAPPVLAELVTTSKQTWESPFHFKTPHLDRRYLLEISDRTADSKFLRLEHRFCLYSSLKFSWWQVSKLESVFVLRLSSKREYRFLALQELRLMMRLVTKFTNVAQIVQSQSQQSCTPRHWLNQSGLVQSGSRHFLGSGSPVRS